MDRLRQLILGSVLLGILAIPVYASLQAAEQPKKPTRSEDKLRELGSAYREQSTLAGNTLAPALLGGGLLRPEMSLFDISYDIGYLGELDYQREDGKTLRIQFHDLEEPAAIYWQFREKFDARNRWFRLQYAGPAVPSHLILVLESHEALQSPAYDLYLRDSLASTIVYFKLPGDALYSDIRTLKFWLDPDLQDLTYADFRILGLELLQISEDPLAGPPAEGLGPFEWYADNFKANNKLAVNRSLHA